MARLFPVTAGMRYERMALAVFGCLVCLLLGVQGVTWAYSAESWRAAIFAAGAAAFLSMSLACLCFGIIKLPVAASWVPIFRKLRALGLGFVGLAFVSAVAWAALHLATALLT